MLRGNVAANEHHDVADPNLQADPVVAALVNALHAEHALLLGVVFYPQRCVLPLG